MPSKDEFHRIRIGPIEFVGMLSADGPYVARRKGRDYDGGVALGPMLTICQVEMDRHSRSLSQRTWAICKYSGNEPRIMLEGMTDSEVRSVAAEFGIEISDDDVDEEHDFLECPAWGGLKNWVKQHPRMAREWSHCQEYIHGWHRQAVEENLRDAQSLS